MLVRNPDVGHPVEHTLEHDRTSARASDCPRHECTPRLNATCSRALLRSICTSCGDSKRRGSRFAAPFGDANTRPRGDCDAAQRRRAARHPEMHLDRALQAQHLFDEVRNQCTLVRNRSSTSGCSARCRIENVSRRTVVSCPATKINADFARQARDVGLGSVAEGRCRDRGEHIAFRFDTALDDVRANDS